MPFIKAKVSCSVTADQETKLKKRLGKAIELVPGKSEEYLLLDIECNCHIWLRGVNSEPTAFIEAAVFGNEEHYGYDAFTKECTRAVQEVLGISPGRIYIRYEDISAWAVNGYYIDRRHFR